jgi:glycogen debranching enzyme
MHPVSALKRRSARAHGAYALLLLAVCALGRAAAGTAAAAGERLEWQGTRVTVDAQPTARGLRRYRFRVLRGDGTTLERAVTETGARPRLRTGNRLFDGLFALTMQEVAEDSVTSIRDAAFNDGRPIDCVCFETGAKWHYVWTRDVSYAADLGLALLEPQRTRASLEFKSSGLRPEVIAAGLEPAMLVAQDTGSGGSWPISTDRVVWLHAAMRTLDGLDAADGSAFARRLYRIAVDTLTQDREFAFDPAAGLYRGETSFLDWREQNYPPWTARDTRFIAESYALSTNVLHYVALRDAALLAQRVPGAEHTDFEQQARSLRAAINRAFWLEDVGLYASYLAPGIHPRALHTYDLLGESLAVVGGVADARQSRRLVRAYPRTAAGSPVVFPQRPGVPIYHNRALWPFVTAYAIRSAARARQPGVAAALIHSLLRGTATALSNMENFEFLTEQTALQDGPLSGPVINSPRQLWSVAAFAGVAIEVLWGLEADPDAIRVAPFMPAAIAAELAGPETTLRLRGLRHRGFVLDVDLKLPATLPADAWLEAGRVSINGRPLESGRVPLSELRRGAVNQVRVTLRVAGTAEPAPPLLAVREPAAPSALERAQLFAPTAPPAPSGTRSDGVVRLELPPAEAGTTLELIRDGESLGAVGATTMFAERLGDASACYSLVARSAESALDSLPGPELCLPAAAFAETVRAGDARIVATGAAASDDGTGQMQYADWGAPEERLELEFVAHGDGLDRLRLEYLNAHGPVNTGITAAVKRASVRCGPNAEPQRGVVVMPHIAPGEGAALSTAFVFRARDGQRCRLVLSDGVNMSYLAHFALYTGGAGGRTGPLNRATIRAFRIELADAATH